MYGTVWKGQQSFIKMQDTVSTRIPDKLVGGPNRSMGSRHPAEGSSETQSLVPEEGVHSLKDAMEKVSLPHPDGAGETGSGGGLGES